MATSQPTEFQVHYSYLVSLSEREAATEYKFDGFYALQATDLFASTLAQWAQTPEIIVAAHEAAGLSIPTRDPRTLVRIVTAEKTAPQLVEVTIKQTESEAARRLTEGLRTVMQRQIDLYHTEGIPALQFRAVATEPWVGERVVATNVIVIATFIFVFVVALNLVLFWESLKGSGA